LRDPVDNSTQETRKFLEIKKLQVYFLSSSGAKVNGEKGKGSSQKETGVQATVSRAKQRRAGTAGAGGQR